MNKTRIVIASVLKPVTEPRAFSKLALSLRETNKYRINIIGFCSKKSQTVDDIGFTAIFCRKRTHISRLFASLKFLRVLFQDTPAVVIVTTYELLPAALLGKAMLRFKLVYDMQENYAQNILLNHSTPNILRRLLAGIVRGVERTAHPWVDHYFFAEQVYARQFQHINKFSVIENKFTPPFPLSLLDTVIPVPPHFVISGTITPVYGIEKAVLWFLALQEHLPEATLTIIGHVPLEAFRKKLIAWAALHHNIYLQISTHPIDYHLILNAVQQAAVVLMPYELVESIRYKIPSKLYESVALRKPLIISENPSWSQIVDYYPAGISIDFTKTDNAVIDFQTLQVRRLYRISPGPEVQWEGEAGKLVRVLEDLVQ